MGGPTGWWTGKTSARPSDASESSWSAILEATPDPQDKCWVSPSQAESLLVRVQSAGDRLDPRLYQALSKATKTS
jgi:hypothetical protein